MLKQNSISSQESLLAPEQSKQVAKALVELGAVKITTGQPFIYTFGWASPVYINTRLLMSQTAARKALMDLAAEVLRPVIAQQGINALVGAESSGIAMTAWLTDRLELPMLYLRKRPMGWGNEARLEGQLPEQAKLLYVDDVTTDGRSKVSAIETLRHSGSAVADALVLVDYAIYPESRELFVSKKVNLHALTCWSDLYDALLASGTLSDEEVVTLEAFSRDPVGWSFEHGGVGA